MTDAREHSFPEGTVSVKLHKRKRLTLVVGATQRVYPDTEARLAAATREAL